MTTPSYVILRWSIVGLTALVTAGGAFWIARRPTRIASRLGMRGLKRQRALLDPLWASVEPLIRWTGVRVSGILSDKRRDKLDLSLTHAGDYLGLTVDEYFGTILLMGMLGGLVGGLVTSFVMELLVYPAIYLLWKWNSEVKKGVAAPQLAA